MFKWLREAAENKIVQSHLSEMMPYLRQLTGASDEDVAAIYLTALAFRNIYKRASGIDLFNPQEAIEKHKTIALEIGAHIHDAQKSTLYVSAAGLKMWLFTIRSLMHDELRPVGVALWRQISRGFPYVHVAVEDRGRSQDRTILRDTPHQQVDMRIVGVPVIDRGPL